MVFREQWIHRVLSFFSRWKKTSYTEIVPVETQQDTTQVISHDASLLERSRTQWQFGDWNSLTKLEIKTLQNHPDRAKLALLAASGHQQEGNIDQARAFIHLAQKWGCNKKLIRQMLIAGVHNSLGKAYAITGKQQRSFEHFEKSLSIGAPGSELKLLTRARMDKQLGEIYLKVSQIIESKSLVCESNLLPLTLDKTTSSVSSEIQKTKGSYLNTNGELLYRSKNYKLAAEYFHRALELDPENAWYCQNLAESLARMSFRQDDCWECEQLGEAIRKLNKWEVVVRHYRRALQLDAAAVEAHQKAQTFDVPPRNDDMIDNPVFIVGCGHSGTSLMLAILGNHPKFNPIQKESALFLCTDDTIASTMHKWDTECKNAGKNRWVEKTPPHIFQIPRFLAFRPNSRIIVMLRDGRDVVCSLKPRSFHSDFNVRINRWVYDNMAALPYWDHPHVKVVKYEELVTNTDEILHEICDFIDEDYSQDMLEYHKAKHYWYSKEITKPQMINNHSDHMNLRNWQINQPLFDGRFRWRTEMTEEEKKLFKQSQAQHYLERFGYDIHGDW